MPVATPTARRWLTQAEAADRLAVTDRTIRNYIARGHLRGYRIRGSRAIRLDLAEVDALVRPIPSAASSAGGGF
jgi:excisionase family DNA binding protein